MNITIVNYRAYDKPHARVYIDKTIEQIHEDLKDGCFTYEPTSVIEAQGTFSPLDILNRVRIPDLAHMEAIKEQKMKEAQLRAEKLKAEKLKQQQNESNK